MTRTALLIMPFILLLNTAQATCGTAKTKLDSAAASANPKEVAAAGPSENASEPVNEEAAIERLRDETKSLLKQIVQDLTKDLAQTNQFSQLGQCSIDKKWLDHPLDDWAASHYFGISVHAGLTVINPLIAIEDAIEIPGVKDPFCSLEEFRAYANEMGNRKPDHAGEDQRLTAIQSFGFSFPIFDHEYSRAAVAIEGWRYAPSLQPLSGFGTFHIYSKAGGAWQWVDSFDFIRFPE